MDSLTRTPIEFTARSARTDREASTLRTYRLEPQEGLIKHKEPEGGSHDASPRPCPRESLFGKVGQEDHGNFSVPAMPRRDGESLDVPGPTQAS